MSRSTFERFRIPAALILIILAAFVFLPRGDDEPAVAGVAPTPSSTVTVGQPTGAVVPSAATTPIPLATIAPTPEATATPEPTATPVADTDFEAEVLACRSVSGDDCQGPLGTLPGNAPSFTALVLFTDATAGDLLNAVLDGPSGTIAGTPYALQGSGDGYFWAEFQVGGLPNGEYTLTATRNGNEVAQTSFRRGG